MPGATEICTTLPRPGTCAATSRGHAPVAPPSVPGHTLFGDLCQEAPTGKQHQEQWLRHKSLRIKIPEPESKPRKVRTSVVKQRTAQIKSEHPIMRCEDGPPGGFSLGIRFRRDMAERVTFHGPLVWLVMAASSLRMASGLSMAQGNEPNAPALHTATANALPCTPAMGA